VKKILVVDDLAENRYFLKTMLWAYGFEVVSACDGAEALSLARLQPPDLVISDILMPTMDGFELCRQWHTDAVLCNIPFIFFSAVYTTAQDEQLGLGMGADRFVIKPQEPQMMFEIIQEVLGRRRTQPAVIVAPPVDEITILREYNATLVRKLQTKVAELEASRGALKAEILQRNRVEADLRRSEERWGLIYDMEPECVKIVSSAGRLVDMNRSGLTMIEAGSMEEARRLPLLSLIAPEDRDAFSALHQQVLDGRPGQLVFEIIGLKGTRHRLEMNATRLLHHDNKYVLGISRNITDRVRAEQALEASREQLNLLSRRLIEAQEAERRHIARELHDQIGQSLTAIKLNLNALQPAAQGMPAQTLLQESLDIVGQTLNQVRELSLDLRPAMLDDLGLLAALRWYLDRQATRCGFAVRFVADSPDCGVSKEVETACFRIVQEAVTNIARHSRARNVRLELHRRESELELLIQDDGIGFDPTVAHERAVRGESLGLVGMQERIAMVGGGLEIQSVPSGGTIVSARFPLMPPASGSE
jgi:PAS domain S-box-containing protein